MTQRIAAKDTLNTAVKMPITKNNNDVHKY